MLKAGMAVNHKHGTHKEDVQGAFKEVLKIGFVELFITNC